MLHPRQVLRGSLPLLSPNVNHIWGFLQTCLQLLKQYWLIVMASEFCKNIKNLLTLVGTERLLCILFYDLYNIYIYIEGRTDQRNAQINFSLINL